MILIGQIVHWRVSAFAFVRITVQMVWVVYIGGWGEPEPRCNNQPHKRGATDKELEGWELNRHTFAVALKGVDEVNQDGCTEEVVHPDTLVNYYAMQ